MDVHFILYVGMYVSLFDLICTLNIVCTYACDLIINYNSGIIYMQGIRS